MDEVNNAPHTGSGLILGIESSCDETAAAVVDRGSRQLSNVVASQIAIHSPYGGVVPELASREHLRAIVPVVDAALREAGITMQQLDAIAVTEGPGLAGALLVGIGYAKALAYGLGKPLIAVNHLEGHIHAVLLEHAASLPDLTEQAGPLLALVVSGGHTHLYLAEHRSTAWHYRNVGHTVDDAAGEAFDKVAKLLGLGYPGGPWIDTLAPHGNPRAVPFAFAQIKPKAHRNGQRAAAAPYLFSFSGIKTAVLRYVETHNMAASIAARRQQITASMKPDEALPLCDSADPRPSRLLPARRRRRPPPQGLRRSRALWRARPPYLWRSRRQSRAPRALLGHSDGARPAHRLSRARPLHRQRRHDRRRRVAQAPRPRLRPA